ncbi:MAG: bifunctional UDP-sugar hydrolase/5'-nucleotidase [Pseudomonadota bacterium]
MKKWATRILLPTVAVLLLCSCASKEQASDAAKNPIIILHTNDVHAGVDKNIGYAGLVAYRDALEARYGADNVILVDCGDSIQGENIAMLTKGEAVSTLMREVEYDYIILGNHEFDYGMDRMFELTEDVQEHILATNFIRLEDNTPVFAPYAIYTVDDVDIAFLGITTPESISRAASRHFKDEAGNFLYTLGEDADGQTLYTMVQESVDKARAEGADYVIALAHLGIEEAAAPWRSTDLIAHTSGIDMVLDGHSHSIIDGEIYKNAFGEDVILSQAGTKLSHIGQVTIDTTKSGHDALHATLIDANAIGVTKDAQMQERVEAIQAQFAELLNQNIAYSDYDLLAYTETEHTIRLQETNLGDFVADAYKALLGTDVAIVSAGGIRTNLAKGDVTYQDVIDIHPFGNYIMSMEVTGKAIKDALEMGAALYPLPSASLVHVSGITYSIDSSVPSSVQVDVYGNFVRVDGAYRVKDIVINGEALDEARVYTVASHDYLLKQGGDGLTMFKDCPVVMDMFMLDSDVLIEYVKQDLGGNIGDAYANPHGSQRISIF